MSSAESRANYLGPIATIAARMLWLTAATMAAACGGGSDPTPAVNTAPPPGIAYSVVAKTVDTQGQPIAGVNVILNGGVNGRLASQAATGSDGTTTFNFSAIASEEAGLSAYMTGYHPAGRGFQLAGASSPILQQLILMRTDEAQLVLRGVTSQVSADASSVIVSADIDVVGLNGNPIAGLSAADIGVPHDDCQGFGGPCILDPSGAPLSTGYWVPSQRDPVQVTLSGAGATTYYKVRYVLEAVPGMFAAGRTVLTYLNVRVGADTLLGIQVDLRL